MPRRGDVTVSPATARSVVDGFADVYPRYLDATLPARRLPDLSPAGLASVTHSGPLPTRLHQSRLRPIGIQRDGASWTIRYTATVAGHRGTISGRLTLTRTPHGWQVAQVTPPDLAQVIAQHPPSPAVPRLVRVAAVAFTRSYLAYTYAHAPAAALTHLTRRLRARLASRPPTVPAAVRALHPRPTRIAFAPVGGGGWLAIAAVVDGLDSYQLQTTLARAASGWLASHVSAAR